MILLVKRREPTQHLIEEHTERPPVDSTGIALSLDELGREILGRAGEG
jgi:hypothetical protein